MALHISTDARNQIINNNISMYASCKMYDYNDTYICDLNVENASYSKSRDFGISVLRLTIVNSGNEYSAGGLHEIKSGYRVVLIEGFNTSTPTDKFPKFKGYIENIEMTTKQGDSMISIDVYDEMIITNKSDIDKMYVANYVEVAEEELTPVIDNVITIITQSAIGENVLFKYEESNAELINSQLTIGSFYVASSIFKIKAIMDMPYIDTNNTFKPILSSRFQNIPVPVNIQNKMYYTTQVGIKGTDTIKSIDGTFIGVVNSSGTDSIGKYITFTTGSGRYYDGQLLYKSGVSTAYITPVAFVQLNAVLFTDITKNAQSAGIKAYDKVHNGIVSLYKSAYDNWVQFKSHKVRIQYENAAYGAEKKSGFEIIHKKGIIKLNETSRTDMQKVFATYTYYPVGLYAEDIISDMLTLPDNLKIELTTNGNFKQNSYKWDTYVQGAGLTTNDYSIKYGGGVVINIGNAFIAGEGVGIKSTSTFNLKSGYTYTFSFEGIRSKGVNSGAIHIGLVNSDMASQVYAGALFSGASTTKSVMYTPTANKTGVYPVIFVSGCKAGQTWSISDVRVTYNPAKINSLSSGNLYTSVHFMNGSATSTYSLVKANDYVKLPDYTILTDDINDNTSTISAKSTTNFDASGYIIIDNEYIGYTGKTLTSLTGITRGALGSEQTSHDVGTRTYHVVSAGRVWYTEYNNIVPKTSSVTASTYNSVSGVNVGSGGSFTITGAGAFSKFYYREGMLLLNAPATNVTHTANKNYYFNGIQATGIEVPYILFDQTQVKTKFDGLGMMRKFIAPNYIIDIAVRSTDTNVYTSFVRGRYLTQSAIEDYALTMMTDVNYKSSSDTYNRVKMFGKNALPKNLMYDQETVVMGMNDLGSSYLKDVPATYAGTDGAYYTYKFNDVRTFLGVDYDKSFNVIISNRAAYNGNRIGYSQQQEATLRGSKGNHYYADYNRAPEDRILLINSLGDMRKIIAGGMCGWTVTAPPGVHYGGRPNVIYNYNIDLYNVYIIKYTTPGTSFAVGNTLGNGKITFIKRITGNRDYDQVIFVRHNVNGAIFTDSQVVSNGTVSATIYLPAIDGNIDQANVNTTQYAPSVSVGGIYTTASYSTIRNDSYQIDFDELISNVTNVKVQVNDIYLSDNPQYKYNQIDFEKSPDAWNRTLENDHYHEYFIYREPHQLWRNWYRKELNRLNIYLADTAAESNALTDPDHPNVKPGQILFESITDSKSSSNVPPFPFKLEWRDPSYLNEHISNQAYNATLGEQLRNGNYLYYDLKETKGYSPVQSILRDTNRISFYQKFQYTIDWKTEGDFIKLRKTDVDRYFADINDVKILIDGNFVIRQSTDMVSTTQMPAIERLRDWVRVDIDQQMAITSKQTIDNITLFVVDLGSVKDIGYIDIQPGYFFKPVINNDKTKYEASFKLTIESNASDVPFNINIPWSSISEDTTDQELTSGDVLSLTKSELGERFKARYLRFIVSCDQHPTISEEYALTENKVTTEILNEWYGAAIGGLAIYENDVLVSEKYVVSGLINLYKDTNVYEELYTQDMVDNYAQAVLNEFQKNHTLAQVNIPWSPHLEVGQTVNITDSMNGVNRDYFIEGITSNNGSLGLDLAYYP